MTGPFAKFSSKAGLEVAVHYSSVLVVTEMPAGTGVALTLRAGNSVTTVYVEGTVSDAVAKLGEARRADINSFDPE